MMLRVSFICLLVLAVIAWFWTRPADKKARQATINGVSLEAPRNPVGDSCFAELSGLQANWVAVIPYAFIGDESGTVIFNHSRQWWGEKEAGIREVIQMAHESGMKVLLKPQVWVRGDGWPGDFLPKDSIAWENWQSSYRDYLMMYVALSEELGVEMICVGTEFRKTAVQHPEYWRSLIREVKSAYKGKLTYAANWDNYTHITFWEELDYIGIDAYFPLTNELQPAEEDLIAAWQEVGTQLEEFSNQHNRNIIFTEYGYRSVEGAARGHWDDDTVPVADDLAQANAYAALYKSVWNEPWLEGGFLWKWHMDPPNPNRVKIGFSPQKKPAEQVIQRAYSGQ